jgi:hypothetical protein
VVGLNNIIENNGSGAIVALARWREMCRNEALDFKTVSRVDQALIGSGPTPWLAGLQASY